MNKSRILACFTATILFIFCACINDNKDKIQELEMKILANKILIDNNALKIHELENKLTTNIESYSNIISIILSENENQNMILNQYKVIEPDLFSTKYNRIDSGAGLFVLSIKDVEKYLDGVKVKLHVGNLTTARFYGGMFIVEWNTHFPSLNEGEAVEYLSKLNEWRESLIKKEISFTDELIPGKWTSIEIILPGIPLEKFGHISLELKTDRFALLE
jgi:hypothetical protein